MGIPRMFRWLSERYPLANQNIEKNVSAPIFDNFYLDMNGIIHNCSRHAESEEEIFTRMFHYIDHLFHLVNPTRVLFLAIDGVAPRAKLNQQRQRRFKKIIESEKDKVKQTKNPGPPPNQFQSGWDSNCITPGTPFMARLSEKLDFFIRQKIQEDKLWQQIDIIFSGHEVPGEGEHKIMEYIRHAKAQPNWDPNTRHCLYGLDADLIMLSLTLHEPHTALLREEVLTARSKKVQDETSQYFHLFHISILREYWQLEFSEYFKEQKVKFECNLERIVDDFVLLCFALGNDFLPHLPTVDINEGSLDSLFDTYKQLLPTFEDYLTNQDRVNFSAFEKILQAIGDKEKPHFQIFPTEIGELTESSSSSVAMVGGLDSSSDQISDKKEQKFVQDMKSIGVNVSQEEQSAWQDIYYQDKFKKSVKNPNFPTYLIDDYLHGIVWVLKYYHHGVRSWSWFYPWFYAPLATDIAEYLSHNSSPSINFTLSQPFKPYQQLVAVLPRESSKLLPEAYQRVMNDPNSPLDEFFPDMDDIVIDLNNKKNDWEAILKVPFIDQEILRKCTEAIPLSALSSEERERNERGETFLYTYTPNAKNGTLKSGFKELFNDIPNCVSAKQVYQLPPFPGGLSCGFSLPSGVILERLGFPTFHSLFTLYYLFNVSLQDLHVRIFSFPSSKPTLTLEFPPPQKQEENNEILVPRSLLEMINTSVLVNWPFLREAFLVAVSTPTHIYRFQSHQITSTPLRADEQKAWKEDFVFLEKTLRNQGILIRDAKIKIHFRVLERVDCTVGAAFQKIWSSTEQTSLYPLILETNRIRPDPRFQVRDRAPPQPGDQVLYIGTNYFGRLATVLNAQFQSVDLNILVGPKVPSFATTIFNSFDRKTEKWVSVITVSKFTKISVTTLLKLTAKIYILPSRTNIGLNVRTKDTQLYGLSRRLKHSPEEGSQGRLGPWEFSQKLVTILMDYLNTFPFLVQMLEDDPNRKPTFTLDEFDKYRRKMLEGEADKSVPENIEIPLEEGTKDPILYESVGDPAPEEDLEDSDDENFLEEKRNDEAVQALHNVREYLKGLDLEKALSHPIGTSFAPASTLKRLAHAATEYSEIAKNIKEKFMKKVNPFYIHKPGPIPAHLRAGFDFWRLGDYVTVATDTAPVPFGTCGTIIGLKPETVEILLDRPFIGGITLNGLCPDLRGLSLSHDQVINLSCPPHPEQQKEDFAKAKKTFTQAPADPAPEHFNVQQTKQPLEPEKKLSKKKAPIQFQESETPSPPEPEDIAAFWMNIQPKKSQEETDQGHNNRSNNNDRYNNNNNNNNNRGYNNHRGQNNRGYNNRGSNNNRGFNNRGNNNNQYQNNRSHNNNNNDRYNNNNNNNDNRGYNNHRGQNNRGYNNRGSNNNRGHYNNHNRGFNNRHNNNRSQTPPANEQQQNNPHRGENLTWQQRELLEK